MNKRKPQGKEKKHIYWAMQTLVSGLDVPAFLTSFELNGSTKEITIYGSPCDIAFGVTRQHHCVMTFVLNPERLRKRTISLADYNIKLCHLNIASRTSVNLDLAAEG